MVSKGLIAMMREKLKLDQPARYRICAQGRLDESWSEYLAGLTMCYDVETFNCATTILTGQLRDQAALLGVLNALYGLGLPLLSVERICDIC